MGRLLGVFRTRLSAAAQARELGAAWMFLGDSQTDGRATGATRSPVEAFCRIWQTKYPSTGPTTPFTNLPSNPYKNGVSGRSLAESKTHYDGRAERTNRTWVHFQESGNQNLAGQATATAYGDTFDGFVTAIRANTASAVISTETAFSFGREAEAFRNWDTYNTELRARVATWAASSVIIPIAEVDRDIKLLGTSIGAANVWFQSGEVNEFHYRPAGNLMVALSKFKSLGYTITLADLADIPTTEVSAAWQQACLDVYNAN